MRNEKLDLARGMLMIYIVIVIHGVFWLKLIPEPYSTLLLGEMPLIFIVSGFAFSISSKHGNSINIISYWKYVRARVTRIILPYLVYAINSAIIVSFMKPEYNYKKTFILWLNPFRYGDDNTVYCLNWHLWFLPSFLIVALLLPLCRVKYINQISAMKSLIYFILFFFFINIWGGDEFKTIVFYFFWGYLGYRLCTDLTISNKQLYLIAAIAIFTLIYSSIIFDITLNMQSNKFPPNIIYLLFSVAWSSFILLIARRIPDIWVNILKNNRMVKIFISYGYSLYLWQGLGYSVTIYLRQKYNINVLLLWPLAIFITIIFGCFAKPIEKIRWHG